MATTLAASAYFLTCCRPIHNSFCFLVEKPKLINFYHYPLECFLKHPLPDCKYSHDDLRDHSLNIHNHCTDDRAWSLDDCQKRQHFQDLICHRIPHCGPDEGKACKREDVKKPVHGESQDSKAQCLEKEKEKKKKKKKEEKEKEDLKDDKDLIEICPPDEEILTSECSSEEKLPSAGKSKEDVPSVKSEKSECSSEEKLPSAGKSKEDVPSVKSKKSEKARPEPSVKSDQIKLPSSLKSKESENIEPDPSVKSLEPKESEKLGLDPSVVSLEPKESEKEETIFDPSAKSIQSDKPELQPSLKSKESEKLVLEPKDVVGLTDELIEKLDRNLRNLESTFDKFVKKNKDFIQNLMECLDFERQKQASLEDDYDKLKQENEALKTQNDYLKMVNNKQLDLFKNELDRGISENKVIYKRKIHLMERQLQNDQNELQMYKQTEKKYMEVVEQDNEKIEKLNNKIDDLKNKETQLVKNYLQLLKFLENVKNILSSADPKEIPQLRSLNTMADSEGENEPDVKRVLKNALNNGISTLNVRDLSILHDAIEGLNEGLCHQTDKCTKSPNADSSLPDFSNMSIHRLIIEHSHEDDSKQFEGYNTSSNPSVDKIPTRQKPEDRKVSFK